LASPRTPSLRSWRLFTKVGGLTHQRPSTFSPHPQLHPEIPSSFPHTSTHTFSPQSGACSLHPIDQRYFVTRNLTIYLEKMLPHLPSFRSISNRLRQTVNRIICTRKVPL
jgi:hypothetical protein